MVSGPAQPPAVPGLAPGAFMERRRSVHLGAEAERASGAEAVRLAGGDEIAVRGDRCAATGARRPARGDEIAARGPHKSPRREPG